LGNNQHLRLYLKTEVEMSKKAVITARITLTHKNGKQTVIEVEAQPGFASFYRWYQRLPGRRDKTHMRNSGRNDAPDLTALAARVKAQAERMAQIPTGYNRQAASERAGGLVVTIKLIVFKKKLYKQLLECSPTDLLGGMPRMNTRGLIEPRFTGAKLPTLGHTSIARKWALLTGKA
jgi:hypothetical protein